ncbi:MAG TPA: ABC transporter permease subunit/CPBP intramembrane protease [Gemmataceae bacterium]|nr:ABC transporter permease subunit/CPBP intramembrane protease [Gemmataceae bacterium]
MRWSIIRTIWFREMRDQLRDRRTLFMIIGLPLILYPVLSLAVLRFASGFADPVVGVVTGSPTRKQFPPRESEFAGRSVLPPLAFLSVTPLGCDLSQWYAAGALARASELSLDYTPLIRDGLFTTFDHKVPRAQSRAWAATAQFKLQFLERYDPVLLDERRVDIILEAAPHFYQDLEAGEDVHSPRRPGLTIHTRHDDDRSRMAVHRLTPLLDGWKNDLKKVRLVRKGLTEKFLDPFDTAHPEDANINAPNRDNIADLVVKVFPFMLVMWTLAGALYPAVDLCAGEKERGTMETLLITPAGREEIVVGKFLAIWVFSSATALLNLISMGIATSMFAGYLPHGGIAVSALAWCVVLALPQSAFFSALSLAIGAYARSSKEGQYYLMPLFVLTMPLIFLTLAPGVELNPLYSLVPVTGVALLMQRLMTAPTLADIPWAYFVPVLAPIGLYSWLALRWAIAQFNREEVLFREAERLDVMLWFKSLFRDKEPVPTAGQAFFAVGMFIGLHWLSLGFGDRWSLEMHTAISELAFVAMPALFMVLLLNTQPGESLYLNWPRGREAGLAALLALLMLPAMTGLTQAVAAWFPRILEGAHPERMHPLIEILRAIRERDDLDASSLVRDILAFALVPAICEELAFRGLVLRGLHHSFRPRNAVLLSSFFYALFHMNVFLFVPTFVLGVILGLLTVRSKSLLPAILFHLLHNAVLIALIPLSHYSEGALPAVARVGWPIIIALCLGVAGALVWWLYRKPYVDLARREAEAARK